jgi:hypothetical protein
MFDENAVGLPFRPPSNEAASTHEYRIVSRFRSLIVILDQEYYRNNSNAGVRLQSCTTAMGELDIFLCRCTALLIAVTVTVVDLEVTVLSSNTKI